MSKRTIRFLAIAVTFLILGYLAANKLGWFEKAKDPNRDKPAARAPEEVEKDETLPVKAVRVTPDLLKESLRVSGTIYPDEEVAIASEVSGKVVRMAFREGGRVKKGQLLAKVDDAELKATFQKLTYQIKLAQQQEDRKEQLLEIGGISQEEYDESLTSLNTLQAEKALLEVQLAKTEIRAPFGGIIGLRNLSEGSYLTPGMVIARLVKTDPVKIEFAVPERYSNRIANHARIRFELEGLGETFEGKVYAKSASIDMETRTLLVKAQSPNPTGKITPGAFANVDIFLAEYPDAIMVPTQAIIPEQGSQKVFVVKHGKAESRTVTVGIRQAERIQVMEGLSVGDTVITTGLLQVSTGTPVEITEML
jgi:membrane fusion protein (multidrug efflux system)